LRDLGVHDLYVKAAGDAEARALNALGVSEGSFPKRSRCATPRTAWAPLRCSTTAARRGPLIQEIAIPPAWVGRSLRTLDPRGQLGIQVIAVLRTTEAVHVPPDPDAVLKDRTR
jgi:Trk K+ transport system NAD-binding subunit